MLSCFLTLHKQTRCCPQGQYFFCLGFNNLCFSPKKVIYRVGEFCFHGSKFQTDYLEAILLNRIRVKKEASAIRHATISEIFSNVF